MLKQTKEFQGASLVRTRDPSKLAECNVVVDVGGVYDPAQHKYDHHQVKKKSFSFEENIYKHNTKILRANIYIYIYIYILSTYIARIRRNF